MENIEQPVADDQMKAATSEPTGEQQIADDAQMETDKKDDSSDGSSSETSSYHSENSKGVLGKFGKEMVINGVRMDLGDLSEEDEEDLAAIDIDGEADGPNSYVRFKT